MEITASHRIDKTKAENIKDFYQTPTECTLALIDWLKEDPCMKPEARILDPCCGEGAISNELKKQFPNITEFDLYDEDNPMDFFDYQEKSDMIIMNPPYSNKYEFLKRAFKLAKVTIAILPMQIANYNMFHRDYLNIPSYTGRILLTPKIMMGDENKIKRVL